MLRGKVAKGQTQPQKIEVGMRRELKKLILINFRCFLEQQQKTDEIWNLVSTKKRGSFLPQKKFLQLFFAGHRSLESTKDDCNEVSRWKFRSGFGFGLESGVPDSHDTRRRQRRRRRRRRWRQTESLHSKGGTKFPSLAPVMLSHRTFFLQLIIRCESKFFTPYCQPFIAWVVRGSEEERERECVWVCIWGRKVERRRVCACVSKIQSKYESSNMGHTRKKQNNLIQPHSMCVWVGAFVCVLPVNESKAKC